MNANSPIAPAEIVRIGHPALRRATRLVPRELFGTPALSELVDTMRATLAGRGVGLAAPQIAVPLRLFVIEDSAEKMSHLSPEQQKARNRYPYPFEVIVNPTWYAVSSRIAIEQEGCLSIPGLKADVARFWEIEVTGLNPGGEPKRWSVKGWPARIFQHEIDHLDGRLLTDLMVPGTLVSTEPYGAGATADLMERLGLSPER